MLDAYATACGLRLEFALTASTAALVSPALPALESLIGLPLPPAELLAQLARAGLDLVPRQPDAALLSRACKVRPRKPSIHVCVRMPRSCRARARCDPKTPKSLSA